MTSRKQLRDMAVPVFVLASLLAVACAPAAAPVTVTPVKPAATAVSAKPTQKPAAKPTEKPAAKPTEKSAAKPAAKAAFDKEAVADFYSGNTIRIIVAYSAGGGLDTYARALSRYMPKYLPGEPNIIVENKPGAGGLVTVNAVYNTEPKDGTVIGAFPDGVAQLQLLGEDGVQFDAAKFQWLGHGGVNIPACGVRSDLGINSIQEVIDGREVIVAATAPGSPSYNVPRALNATLGTKFKLVPGYKGNAEMQLAIERGEADGYCVNFGGDARRLVTGENPLLKALVFVGAKAPDRTFLEGVPSARQLAKTEEAKQLLGAVSAPGDMSKPFAVALGVPQDRVAALRQAMAQAFADPQFLAELEKAQQEPQFDNGEVVTEIVQDLLSTPPATLAKLKEVLQ